MKMAATMTFALLLASPALAQDQGHQGMDHSQMDQSQMNHPEMMQPTAPNPYAPSEMKMHEQMMAAVGADAGETWIRKMIEHHRGAIDMSQIALTNTQNADVRREAQKTIDSQNREIVTLNAMLRGMGKQEQ